MAYCECLCFKTVSDTVLTNSHTLFFVDKTYSDKSFIMNQNKPSNVSPVLKPVAYPNHNKNTLNKIMNKM